MSLQQKLLCKKSKKAFTLVELVIVVAILAILSAIAIPAVIGIINSASQSSDDTNASEIDAACKQYFTQVRVGQINQTNKGLSSQSLPSADSGFLLKLNAAKNATVKNALEYAGLYSQMSNKVGSGDNIFVYDSDGTIHAVANPDYASLSDYVTEDVSLGTLYQNIS